MKKLLCFFATVLLILTSCNKEDLSVQSVPHTRIKASFEDALATRLAVGEDNMLTWSKGDAFTVLNNEGVGVDYTLEGEGGTANGEFSGAELQGEIVGAAFPASNAPVYARRIVTMTLPSELEYEEGICNLPMWASFNSLEGPVSFKHLAALLKIDFSDIPDGYDRLVVTADKPIAGTFVAATYLEEPVLEFKENGSNSVTISFDDNGEDGQMFYLPLPVGKYGSINVSISDGADMVSIADWKNRSIQRKKVYKASLTYRVSDAATAADLTAELAELAAVTSNASVEVSGEISAQDGAITIPADAKKLTLNFNKTPVTSEQNPLVIEEEDGTAAGASYTINLPSDAVSYMTVNTPSATVNVTGGGYEKITAHTAANTLVLSKGTRVKDLIVKGGNIALKEGGKITGSITRDPSNTDKETSVSSDDESALAGVTIGEGVKMLYTDYITFVAEAEQTLSFSNKVESFEYSVNNGPWVKIGTSAVAFGGDKGNLRLRGKSHYGTYYSPRTGEYAMIIFGDPNVPVACTGDIRTLVDYENYDSDELDTSEARFLCLFMDCTNLISAPKLPATELASSCYQYMFRNCPGLTSAPALPATSIAQGCYNGMFLGCSSLVSAPALPATTLASNCYSFMFQECSNLTEAPELPATVMADYCYNQMFAMCKKLAAAPALPATTLAFQCYYAMFWDCDNLTEPPALPATTMVQNCYGSMFADCSSLVSAPALPATTLAQYCYGGMFADCSSLVSAPALPATDLAPSCYYRMFSNCVSLTSAPELPATTLSKNCYSFMFSNCSSLVSAPVLPAPVLVQGCYWGMFCECSSLNNVTMKATEISDSSCLSVWLYRTAPTGTLYKKSALTDESVLQLPEGWVTVNI